MGTKGSAMFDIINVQTLEFLSLRGNIAKNMLDICEPSSRLDLNRDSVVYRSANGKFCCLLTWAKTHRVTFGCQCG